MKTKFEQLAIAVAAAHTISAARLTEKAIAKRRREALTKDRALARVQAKEAAKARWQEYNRRVRELTELQPLHLLPGIENRGKHLALDHRVSVYVAFKAGWSAEAAAALSNLQLMTPTENLRKGTRCYSLVTARIPEAWVTEQRLAA